MNTPTPPIGRLPVPLRRFHGENVLSFSRRAAEANGTTSAAIERTARSDGYSLPAGRVTEQRRELWRQLGGLHAAAFTEPETVGGDEVVTRTLCLRCCAGQRAYGRLPEVGRVCLHHQWWIGDPQCSVRGLPELCAAERQFRRVLVPRGVLVDTRLTRLVETAALRVSEDLLVPQARQKNAAQASWELRRYPEFVALTCMITDPLFGKRVLTPAPKDERYHLISEAVASTLNWVDVDRLWNVVNSLWQLLNLEYDWVTSALLRGAEPSDGQWNLLRYWTENTLPKL